MFSLVMSGKTSLDRRRKGARFKKSGLFGASNLVFLKV